jgi:hypothetical protein
MVARRRRLVVFTPGREQWHLAGPEVLLELRVEREVGQVGPHQIELHLKAMVNDASAEKLYSKESAAGIAE